MTRLYRCTDCKGDFPATREYFFTGQIDRSKDQNRTSLGKCVTCAKVYGEKYRESLKQKKLTRKFRNAEKTLVGKLYVIGIESENPYTTPFKIGISCGNSITKRLTALQTGHWESLRVFYESPSREKINIIEKLLHEKFKDKWVRGEWFRITENDIEEIKVFTESS